MAAMNSLPAIITPSLLTSIRRHPHLPKNTWYYITATTLSILNRPDEIPKVYRHALDHGGDYYNVTPDEAEKLRISRRIREALIKASTVGGMPKPEPSVEQTINALLELKKVTPASLLDEPGGRSPTGRCCDVYDISSSQVLHRGQSFFEKLYGKVSKRIMGQMERSGTEDLGLVAKLMYGYLLSNTGVLSPVDTSFVLISGLIPQDVNPQLKGHLKGAINGGATVDEVRAVRNVVMDICEASGMRMLDASVPGGWGWRSEVATI